MQTQRSAWKWLAISALMITSAACGAEGVGDPCVPEAIPCSANGCGFASSETYLEASSVQCRSRMCLVYKLDNKINPVADPRVICTGNGNDADNCVTNDILNAHVYCTCKCAGPKLSELCECPSGFACEEIKSLDKAGAGLQGSYCVRPVAAAQ